MIPGFNAFLFFSIKYKSSLKAAKGANLLLDIQKKPTAIASFFHDNPSFSKPPMPGLLAWGVIERLFGFFEYTFFI